MEDKLVIKNRDDILKAGISPKKLWSRFIDISAIPRCSGNELAVANYIKQEAARHALKYRTDDIGNIAVTIQSTNSSTEPLILQSHLDMVCESSRPFDFVNQPIKLIYENGKIHSDRTTLGADNGIGIAAMLSLMDETFPHPPLLLLFTVDEETGLNGANYLTEAFVTGDRLINLDGEEFGKIYIGCAGGIITTGSAKIEKISAQEKGYRIVIDGLTGGHSGVDIDKGRINAIKLLFKILEASQKFNIKIASIDAGDKINSIPRAAKLVILPPNPDIKRLFINKINEMKRLSNENINLDIKEISTKNHYSEEFSKRLINLINKIPNGVTERYNKKVYTSSNLASIKEKGMLTIKTFQRSYSQIKMNKLSSEISKLFQNNGFSTAKEGEFPGWEPDDSNLLSLATHQFEKLFGKSPNRLAIHAGLECGIIKKRCNIKELISFGPTITNAHSPDESVDVDSVDKFYKYLKKLIEAVDE